MIEIPVKEIKKYLMVSSVNSSLIKKLEKNPAKFGTKLSVRELVEILKKADHYYYNTDKTLFSDYSYNTLREILKEKDPDNPYLKRIGAPIKGKGKVKLPYFMPSLEKIKGSDPESVERWASTHPGPYLVSDKLDGTSILLVEKNGRWNLYTRGNGVYGGDISFLAPYIKGLPKPKRKGLAIRAEGLIPYKVFKRLKVVDGRKPENPRNTVAGILNPNRVKVSSAISKIKIVAYEVINPKMKPSRQYKFLKSLGFKVAPYTIFKEIDAETLTKYLEQRKKRSKYGIDGLVVTQNKTYTRVTSGAPSYAKAFKVGDEEEMVVVTVKRVEWNASRHGKLFPRIVIKPKRLESQGVTIRHITGYNADFIYKNKIGKGTKLKIIRSGDVIPHIVSIVKSTKAEMPKIKYYWDKNKTHIYSDDIDIKSITKIKRIEHFFSTLGIFGVKGGLISKLFDAGFTNIFKLIRIKPNELLQIEGIKEKTASKIVSEIRKILGNVEITKLMVASGCFGESIGEKLLRTIYEADKDILLKKLPEEEVIERILAIPGFSRIRAEMIAKGIPKFRKFFKKIKKYVTVVKPKKVRKESNKLAGQVVVFTGFRDKDLETLIEKNGGKVGNSVNRETTILLVKDKSTTSSKAEKARSLGIKLMTSDEFIKRYSLEK